MSWVFPKFNNVICSYFQTLYFHLQCSKPSIFEEKDNLHTGHWLVRSVFVSNAEREAWIGRIGFGIRRDELVKALEVGGYHAKPCTRSLACSW